MKIISFCIALTSILLSFTSRAATNTCEPIGGSKSFDFGFSYNITDPTENNTGKIFPDIYHWNLGANYIAVCDCQTWPTTYFTATIPNLAFDRKEGDLSFYKITDRISIATKVYIGGNLRQMVSTPFNEVSNLTSLEKNKCGATDVKFNTGSEGTVSLLISQALVGENIIPNTQILSINAATAKGVISPVDMANVYMNGTITIPQSCVINNNQIIEVPFGEIRNSAISTLGLAPDGFIPKKVDLDIKCTNISDGVKLSLTFSGAPSDTYPDALKTTNKDVGIKIEDVNGNAININNGKLPILFDYPSQSGNVSINTFPVNTTGNIPEGGGFDGTATITTNIE